MIQWRVVLERAFFATIFSVYLATLSPSIAGGDSGELVAEGCALGTAHPPGYPLLTLIVHVLKWVPYESVAFKHVSSLFTTIAGWGIAETVKALSANDADGLPGAIIAAGTFCFSPLLWQYAVTAEVFPLNTMMASLLVMLTAKFSLSGNELFSYLGAFVCGLALCNQHTIILFVVPLVFWMLYIQRRRFLENPSKLLWHGVLLLIGFSFYLYLPIAAFLNPIAGSWGDVTTLKGFLHHFLRKDYGTFQLFSGSGGKTAEGFSERTIAYLCDAMFNQGLYFIPVVAGIAGLNSVKETFVRRQRRSRSKVTAATLSIRNSKKKTAAHGKIPQLESDKTFNIDSTQQDMGEMRDAVLKRASHTQAVLVGTLVFYFIVFHSLSNLPLKDKLLYGVHQRFWMQPNVVLFTLAGLGYNYIINLLIDKVQQLTSVLSLEKNQSHNGVDDVSISRERANSTLSRVLQLASLIVALLATALQIHLWLPSSNQSNAFYFRDYAKALLAPLPSNSVLLINYDMQWTSVRYMQKCEDLRPDVTVINLSMMTYQWFQTKRNLYPHLTFPAGYHSYENSQAVKSKSAFTLSQFVDANLDTLPIFLSGKLSFQDSVFERKYDLVPVGLVSRIKKVSNLPNGTAYSPTINKAWTGVLEELRVLPDPSMYPEETWEWTIARDFKDRLTDTAAFYLEAALKVSTSDYMPIVNAVYFLESAIYFERLVEGGKPSSALLKNTGLAHVNLIQNKLIPQSIGLPRPMSDIFNSTSAIEWPTNDDWKKWSTRRFVATWGEFLDRPDAKVDPQYERIKQMYVKAVS